MQKKILERLSQLYFHTFGPGIVKAPMKFSNAADTDRNLNNV